MNDDLHDFSGDLHQVLDCATDDIGAPALAARAFNAARRRRTRRRGAVAAVLSSGLVVAVVVASQVGAGPSVAPPTNPSLSPSTSPTDVPSVAEATAAAEIDPAKAQPLWDPAGVEDLPRAGVLLPDELDPVGESGPAIGSAVAVADDGGLCWVLGSSGEWASTAYPEGELEFVGRQVAISSVAYEVVVTGRTALWRRDVSTQEWTKVPYPADFRTQFDYQPSLAVYDDGRILLGQDERWWLIPADGGAATRLPFDRFDDVMTAGSDVLASRFANTAPPQRTVEEWRSGSIVRSQDAIGFQSLQRPVADTFSIAFARARTGYTVPPSVVESDGLLALDREGLTTRAFLPVPSAASYYTDSGGLTPVGWLNPDTVLVAVRPRDDFDTTWLVTWDVDTGELARAASYATGTNIAFSLLAL